jgi:hypothetical protein
MTEQEKMELSEAEELARRFLSWTIDDEDIDIMETLTAMLEMDEDE